MMQDPSMACDARLESIDNLKQTIVKGFLESHRVLVVMIPSTDTRLGDQTQ
jgi:hypothetical protein